MGTFSIEGFATDCKRSMATADNRQLAAKAQLEQAMGQHAPADIIAVLEDAVPDGAGLGEMIVHSSPELTMLYGRVPARFRSGVHNHTVFACIGQLSGEERSTLYERTQDGEGLRVAETLSVKTGEVMSLSPDAIHHIENPNEETASALHIYGGDFGALMDERSLWSADGHQEVPFSFERLLQQSVLAMKESGNSRGLDELAKAIPAIKPMIDAL